MNIDFFNVLFISFIIISFLFFFGYCLSVNYHNFILTLLSGVSLLVGFWAQPFLYNSGSGFINFFDLVCSEEGSPFFWAFFLSVIILAFFSRNNNN